VNGVGRDMRSALRLGGLAALATLGAGGLHLARPGALQGALQAQAAAPVIAARDPAWSPDGARIAVSLLDQIWTMQPDGRDPAPVAGWPRNTPPAVERDPAWAADGRRIAFAADLGSGFDLYVAAPGGGAPQRLTMAPGDERDPSWTPDGRIVYAQRTRNQWGLMVINVDGSQPGVPPPVHIFLDTPADEQHPAVSPDGARVAYASSQQDESGGGEHDPWE